MTRGATTLLIANPAAGGAGCRRDLSGALEDLGRIEARRTGGPGDARRYTSSSPADGEVIGSTPASVEVMPRTLECVVGDTHGRG